MSSIGINNIGLLLIYTALGIYFIKKYSNSKNKKYILFFIICAYQIVNNKLMISINGISFSRTVYADILNLVMMITLITLAYNLYKKRKSVRQYY